MVYNTIVIKTEDIGWINYTLFHIIRLKIGEIVNLSRQFFILLFTKNKSYNNSRKYFKIISMH